MRSTLILSLLLALVVVGAPPLVLGAGPAAAVEAGDTRLLVSRHPGLQIYRGELTILGRLDRSDGTDWVNPGPGHLVTLERKRAGTASYAAIRVRATDPGGNVEFVLRARSNARFRLSYTPPDLADPPMGPSRSVSVASKVRRDLGAREPASSAPARWRGNVDPGWGGRRVALERKTCAACSWKQVARTTSGSNGSWSFRVGAPARGTWRYRARVRSTTQFQTSYSAVLRTSRG